MVRIHREEAPPLCAGGKLLYPQALIFECRFRNFSAVRVMPVGIRVSDSEKNVPVPIVDYTRVIVAVLRFTALATMAFALFSARRNRHGSGRR